jgi:hypothetical protein
MGKVCVYLFLCDWDGDLVSPPGGFCVQYAGVLGGLLELLYRRFCVGFGGGVHRLCSSILRGEKTADYRSKSQVVAGCESCAAESCGISKAWMLLLWRWLDSASFRPMAGEVARWRRWSGSICIFLILQGPFV